MANVVSWNVLFRTFPVECGAGVVVDSNFLIPSVVQQQQFVDDDDDGCVLDNILETSARDVLEPWFRSLSFMYGQWAMGNGHCFVPPARSRTRYRFLVWTECS